MVLALAAGAACSDPATPVTPSGPPAPRLLFTLPGHVGDTLVRPGVEFTAVLSDSMTPRAVRLYVDSGTAAERVVTYADVGSNELGPVAGAPGRPSTFLHLLGALPAGPHTFTLVAVDTAGRAVSARVTRPVAVTEAPYTLAVLPDLGGPAGAAGMNAAGDVAGWVTPEGATARRPALWQRGALQTPVPAGAAPPFADAVAVRVNAVGDLLLQAYRTGQSGQYASGVGLVNSNGTLHQLSGVTGLLAGDLSDARQAVLHGDGGATVGVGRLFDARSGFLLRTLPINATTINAAGQVAGSAPDGNTLYESQRLATDGFTAPVNPNPSGPRYRNGCDRFGRSFLARPVDLDESATLLVDFCANRVFVPNGGAPQYVDRYVGAGAARLSRRGGLVASVDSATSVVHLWRVGADRPTRLRLPAGPVRVDAVAAVNAAGQIAATGTDARTGRPVALLLAPAAP